MKGEMTEILAHFKLLTEYEQLALFHSVSKQFSIDLLGIKKDSVDFIEVKSTVNKLSDLSKKEQSVKKLIDEKLNYANEGEIKQIVIQSNVNLEDEEPAIIDIHVKFFHDNQYKCPVGKFTLFTPKSCLDSYEVIAYKDLSLKIPLNSLMYLELIYGKHWKTPVENWEAGDYGNIVDE